MCQNGIVCMEILYIKWFVEYQDSRGLEVRHWITDHWVVV